MLTIRQIEPTKQNLRRFVKFQINLYAGNSCFVPPLVSDDINTLSPKINPAFDFCEAAYFIAEQDGKIVGRIAAIINRQLNDRQQQHTARFGFFDFIDNTEISEKLMEAAERWALSKGMDKMIGPLGFTDLDREGLLIEGFDELSTMATNYNYPYYRHHIERLGFKQDIDWVEFVMTVPDAIPDKYNRIADIVKKKFGLRLLKYTDRKEIKAAYGNEIFRLVNESYDKLYGFSPLTQKQIDHYIKMYLNILDLRFVSLVVDGEGRLVGIGISMPSLSRALQKSKGELFPFGWVHLLRAIKGKTDRVDLLLVAVKPEYQNKGVNALLFQDLIPAYIEAGFKYAESNPEMEANSKVQSQWEYFERRQHRRRRAYTKKLK